MRVVRLSPYTGKINVRFMQATDVQEEQYRLGVPVQEAFPNLSAEDIEFIVSGLTPSDWDDLMAGKPPPPRRFTQTEVVIHFERGTNTYLLQTGNVVSEPLTGTLVDALAVGRTKVADLRAKGIPCSLSVFTDDGESTTLHTA